MKKILLIFSLFTVFCGFAQVGIGTESPTRGFSLDVAGEVLIQDELKINPFRDDVAVFDRYKFLTRLLTSEPVGEISKLDLRNIKVAPITVFDYRFTNFNRDNVTSVNLQFDASKYIVGLSNFQYIGQNIQKGRIDGNYINIGNFVSRTFVQNGTWHIEIRNRGLNSANNPIDYFVTLIVYDKTYFRELPVIPVDFEGNNTGEANSPLNP